MDIHSTARRHGILDEDMPHAIANALLSEEIDEDPRRWLVIGPDRAANLLEIVILETVEGDELIIHAMALRTAYRKLLDP